MHKLSLQTEHTNKNHNKSQHPLGTNHLTLTQSENPKNKPTLRTTPMVLYITCTSLSPDYIDGEENL